MCSNEDTVQKYITELLPSDVLLGRGSHLVKYEGNVEFRRLIQERKYDYVSAVRHSDKDQIARDVISDVKSSNGRFLRKVENPKEVMSLNVPTHHVESAWVHVDTDVIVEKIKQAFRDSCKDGSMRENLQISDTGGDGVAESGTLHATRRNNHEPDEDANGIAAPTAALVQPQLTLETKKQSPRTLNGSMLQQNASSSLLHQEDRDSLTAQELLQYQQEQEQQQRLLLTRLALQQLYSAANNEAGRMNLAVSSNFPGSRLLLGDLIHREVTNNMEQQHFRALAFPSEESNLAGPYTAHPSPQVPITENTAFQTQLRNLQQATMGSNIGSINSSLLSAAFGPQVATDAIRSLQQRQTLEAHSHLRHPQLAQLIDNRNTLLTSQQQIPSWLPSSLSGSSSSLLLQGQLPVLPNDRSADIELMRLLSGSDHLNNQLAWAILMGRDVLAARTAVQLPQRLLNSGTLGVTARVNDSLLRTAGVATTTTTTTTAEGGADAGTTTESDATLKRPGDAQDDNELEDDNSATPKKMRAKRSSE